MLSKRKFENLVTHGDFTFYGNKKFADQLTIPVEVDLAASSVPQTAIISDSGWINDLTTNIPQTSIIPSSGWIKDNITNLQNTMFDSLDAVYNTCLSKESAENTYATKNNPTFTGTVTFPNEAISQAAINTTNINGWLSSLLRDHGTFLTDLDTEKAPIANATFTGILTFPDGSVPEDYLLETTANSDYLKKEDATSTYLTQINAASTYAPITNPTLFGTVTFNAQGTTIADYLKTSTAASTYATKNNSFFTGILTFPDGSVPEDYLLETTANSDYLKKSDATSTYLTQINAASTYAPITNPTLFGTVTFNAQGTTIADYLKTSTAASTYATKNNSFFTGILTFPDGSVPEDYLLQTTANSDYLKKTDATSTYLTQTNAASTYAPKANPTFTGTIVLNGNVTLAETKANSLTLNDNLSLCTGTNYATPSETNMLGFGYTGAIVTDTLVSAPNITTNTVFVFGTVTLTYGVWLLYGTAGFQVTTAGTITSVQVSIGSSNTSISGNFGVTDQSTQTVRDATYISHQVMRITSVQAASVPFYLLGKYTFTGCTLNSRQGYSSFYAYRIA